MTRTELIAEADEAAKGGGAWTGRLFHALAKALKADEAEIDRLKAALVAAERASVLRAAAEGKS